MKIDGLRSLTVFVQVVQAGSFTAAAVHLGVSTSAVSHAVRQLEKMAGTRLLSRTTRSVALTEDGAQFYQKVLPLVGGLNTVFDDLASGAEHPAGTLRLTMSRSACVMFIEPLMKKFLDAYPDIKLDIAIGAGLVDIVRGGFDAGIRHSGYLEQDMIAVPLKPPVRLALVASPAYLAQHGTPRTPAELHGHDCIRYRSAVSGTFPPWSFEKEGERQIVAVNGRVSGDDAALMLQAALDGAGIAHLWDHFVASHLRSGALVRVLEDWSAPTPFSLYYFQRDAMPLKLRVFIDFLREHGAA